MLDRRRFLSAGVALGGTTAFSRQLFAKVAAAPRNLPSSALYSSDEGSYWAEIRKQFLIPEDEVFLNNGTVGSPFKADRGHDPRNHEESGLT
jgi:hypothetical protein